MMNTAELYKFPSNEDENQEAGTGDYVKAETKDGFDMVAHKITEALAKNPAKLSGREYQVFHAIVMKTWRWRKKNDWANNEQIADLTEISANHISTLKKSLLDKRVLILDGRYIGINPVISEWQNTEKPKAKKSQVKDKKLPKSGGTKKSQIKDKKLPDSGVIKDSQIQEGKIPISGFENPEIGSNKSPIRDTQKKETITKEETNILSDKKEVSKTPAKPGKNLDFSKWPSRPSDPVLDEWLKLRKRKRASVSPLVMSRFGKELGLAANMGFSVDECLLKACERGWTGFEACWMDRVQRQNQAFNGKQSNHVGDQLEYLNSQLSHIPTPDDNEVF